MAAGGSFEYIAEPDSSLQCVICLEVAEDPRQHEKCGRLLCQACLDKHGRKKPCPNCRMEQPQYFQDNRGRRDIQALVVKCSNAECTDTMERQELHKHVHTKCLHTVIACKYKGIGCEAELKREDMAAHEQDDKLHLHMAIDTVNSQQDTIKKSQSVTLKNKESNNESITFSLQEYQKKKEANEMFTSPSFYTSANGYHMALRVYANGSGGGEGTHVTVSAPILEGKYNAGLKWPFIGHVTVTLLNQLEDDNHHTDTISFFNAAGNLRAAGSARGKTKFIPHSELAYDPEQNTQYLKDNTLYFSVSVEVAGRKPWLECTAN